jgi:hypothetical protein
MTSIFIPRVPTLLLAMSLAACADGKDSVSPRVSELTPGSASFTAGSGSTSHLLGRAAFGDTASETFKIKRITGDWHIEVKAKSTFDLAVQTIDFPKGSHSGWHSHPGPVFIQVVSGKMTFYEGNDPTCTPIVRTAGQGYLDAGDHAHIARNETEFPAQNVVTYFAPPGAALRIDEPKPGNCPF